MKKTLAVIAFCSGATGALGAATCVPLEIGQTIKAACFLVMVKADEPALLSADQPEDLEIRIDGQTTVDGFNSGRETATLIEAGRHHVEVLAVSKNQNLPIRAVMSRTSLPLQDAAIRQEAEQKATIAKRSGKAEDISAALDAWSKTGDLPAIGRIQIDLGDSALARANFSDARKAYEDALLTCQSGRDRLCSAEAANNSGLTSLRLGDFEPAKSRLAEAASELDRPTEREFRGLALSNLGLLLWQVGDYQGAISYNDQSRVLLQGRDPVAHAVVLQNLGLCYQSLAQYELAGDYLRSALVAFGLHRKARQAARARFNLGRNYMLQGNLRLARNMLDQALAEATAVQDLATRAETLLNLSEALYQDQLFDEARTDLNLALELHRTSGDRRSQATDLHYLGLTEAALGDTPLARQHLMEGLDIRQSCGLRDPGVDSLYALADLERKAGNPGAALDYAQRALTMLESVRRQVPGAALRASFYSRRRKLFDLLVDLEASRGPAEGLLAAERGRGRALMDLLTEGSLLRQVPQDLLDRRTSVQRELDLRALRLSSAKPDHAEDLRTQVEMLVAEDEEIGSRIRQTANTEKLGYELGSVTELYRSLPPKTALIEYHLGEERGYLWVVERDSIRAFPVPKRADVEASCAPLLKLFPDILGRKRSPEKQQRFERALHLVSLALLGPLRKETLPSKLLIVPDGVLTQIPFAALEAPGNQRLGLTHELVQLPSASYLVAGRAPRDLAHFPSTILAVADPVYSANDARLTIHPASNTHAEPGLARLPFVKDIETIQVAVPAGRREILRGFDASVQAVEKLRLADYAVLHFSTHALIDDRIPELSRIALSMVDTSGRPVDGFLRPYQLSRFSLSGSTVVLSACDTALGKQVLGEGLMGVTASLFSAGAGRLVLTVSEVDAESASEFWSAAYRQMFSGPRTGVERAVTMARRSLAGSARWSDPYYWAAYAVYGVPSGR